MLQLWLVWRFWIFWPHLPHIQPDTFGAWSSEACETEREFLPNGFIVEKQQKMCASLLKFIARFLGGGFTHIIFIYWYIDMSLDLYIWSFNVLICFCIYISMCLYFLVFIYIYIFILYLYKYLFYSDPIYSEIIQKSTCCYFCKPWFKGQLSSLGILGDDNP